jgi:hypothetical protein
MSKNFCCVTWKSLSRELAKHKHEEIADFVNTNGLPASMFAPMIEVLDTMHLNCPCCKSTIDGPAGKPAAQIKQAEQVEVEAAIVKPNKPLYGKCPVCYGYGTSTRKPREIEDEVNCMNCHGTGKISNDTIKERKISAEKAAELDQVEERIRKEQKGKVIDVTFHDDEEATA